jgi:uncharacterized membrane protein
MYCRYCGQQNHDNTYQCIQCGQALHVQTKQQSGKAIAALVISITGLFFCFFIGQIVGLILGYSARKDIRESGGTLTGDSLAETAIIIGWVGLAIDVFIGLFWLAFMGFFGALLVVLAAIQV